MQALLEHSVQCYHPLPSDLCSHCIRTLSQPSPYPQSRVSKTTILLDQTCPSDVEEEVKKAFSMPVLQEVKVNMNITSAEPPLEAIKPFLPLFLDVEPKRAQAHGQTQMG